MSKPGRKDRSKKTAPLIREAKRVSFLSPTFASSRHSTGINQPHSLQSDTICFKGSVPAVGTLLLKLHAQGVAKIGLTVPSRESILLGTGLLGIRINFNQ